MFKRFRYFLFQHYVITILSVFFFLHVGFLNSFYTHLLRDYYLKDLLRFQRKNAYLHLYLRGWL